MAADTPDPMDALRRPLAPLAPNSAFAADLRRRLATALNRTSTTAGGTMSTVTDAPAYVPERLSAITPYLAVKGAREAIAFYKDVFGAVESMAAVVGDDGRIGHAELTIGGATVMLADEYPEVGNLSPETVGGSPVMLNVHVPDADATVARAEAAGATVLRPVEAQAYGDRSGQILDPWGHRWSVNTHVEAVSAEEMARRFEDQGFTTEPLPEGAPETAVALTADEPGRRQGDIFYWTLGVTDGDRASRFFADLFGWEIEAGHQPGGFHIASVTPPGGIHQSDTPTKTLYIRVPDIQAAVARVRELGGTATDPEQFDSGWDSTCTDGYGTEFNLSQPAPKYA
jgi:uncharacterized glyoxalase superfamily protein PhnB